MSEIRRESRCVLIVEDDRDVRLSLGSILAEEGYRVALAQNGVEALRYLRTSPAPGVILLDLMMPVMDGWEFLSVQRQIPSLSSIPVVVLTAGGVLKGPTSPVPVIERLKKPVEMDALLDVVERACDRYRLS